MRRFKVVNSKIKFMDNFGNRKFDTIYVTLNQPPYMKKNILNKTSWEIKDCTITDVTPIFEEEE